MRRWPYVFLVLAVSLTVLALSLPAPSLAAPLPEFRPNTLYRAEVQRVVDGDTCIFLVHLDEGHDVRERVRFLGVDTPETVHPQKDVQYYGPEASAYTEAALPPYREVWLQTDVGIRDRYRRLLAYVWLEEPEDLDDEGEVMDKMLNARILSEGYGQVMTIQPNARYANLFVYLERDAREGERGMWQR